MRGRLFVPIVVAVLAMQFSSLPALANPITGTVVAGLVGADPDHFQTAINHGTLYDPSGNAGLGTNPFFNNGNYNVNGIPGTNSAVLSIISASGPVFAAWGGPGQSYVLFEGYHLNNAAEGVPVKLGKLSFFNGTSDLEKLIFGLKMEIDVNDTNDPNVEKLPINIGIGTTVNGYSKDFDADFLTFSQAVFPGSPQGIIDLALQGVTLHAYEGQEVSAEIYGVFYGDPMFVMTDIQVVPNFIGEIGGFVGNGLVDVPEPTSIALLGIGGITMVGARFRRRKQSHLL